MQPLGDLALLLVATASWPLLRSAAADPGLARILPLLLPIAAMAAAIRVIDELGATRPEDSAGSKRWPRARILLADDNAVSRRAAKLALDRAGFQVDEACDGREAVERALAGNYDLILMDLHMPRCDGLEATKAIRAAEPGHARTPILALTARAMDDDPQTCLDAGMDGYLSKPVSGPALMAAVESWVGSTMVQDHTLVVDEEQSLDELPVLAPGALDELRSFGGGDDDALLVELADMFFRGADEHIGVLREAYAAGDKYRFERAAHTLKGSSGTLGARRLAETCRQYEFDARNGSLPASAADVEALVGMVAEIREALEKSLGIQIG